MLSLLQQLHPGLQRWVKEQNWSGLQPVQQAAFAPLLEGNDCVIEAPTAGGKTEAVLFPLLTRAADNQAAGVKVLYIAPLRALLNNIEPRAKTYAESCSLTAFKWHGDVSQKSKVKQFTEPPDVLLTTPESIEAILLRKAGWREFFEPLEAIVIDEAHNFAAGERGGHLVSLLERLTHKLTRPPQRVALSATIGNPGEMCAWLVGDRDPARRVAVDAGGDSRNDFRVSFFSDCSHSEGDGDGPSAAHRFTETLVSELRGKRSIAFVRSRTRAELIAELLTSVTNDALKVRTHHSAVSKYFREEAEQRIETRGEEGVNVIVSTSTLELGIDIGELESVLQLDGLASPSAFLQRIGRTGRRAGQPRYFRGMVSDREALLLLTATVALGVEGRVEAVKLMTRSFHLLAHQVLCFILQENGANRSQIWRVLSRAHIFSGINRSEFDSLVAHMIRADYLYEADGVLLIGGKAEKRYLPANWRNLFAVFWSAPMYDVMSGRNQVGTLDTIFVSGLELPFHFVLAGQTWRASSIDHENKVIKAVRVKSGVAPRWDSLGGPAVPFETAQYAGSLLHGQVPLPDFLNVEAHAALRGMRIDGNDGPAWEAGAIHYEALGHGQARVVTFAGDVLNNTLAKIFSASGLGATCNYGVVTVKADQLGEGELRNKVGKTLENLAEPAETDNLKRIITSEFHAWRFSPFAEMLPDALAKEALVDIQTDLSGLQSWLRDCRILGLRA